MPAPAQWLTTAELADRLRVSTRTVWNRCRAREWPCHRVPDLRFSPEDVAAIEAMVAQPARKRSA